MNVTAIIIGATGATGKALVQTLIEDRDCKLVKIFVRRPSGLNHPKLEEHVVDFDHVESFRDKLRGDVLFSVMGTTIKIAKNKENQYKVDYSYQYEVAKASADNGVSQLVLQSSLGAKATSKSFYTRTKGELEVAVEALAFEHIAIFRPSFLDARRSPFRLGEYIGIMLTYALTILPFMRAFRPIKMHPLSCALLKASKQKKTSRVTVYESLDIFALASDS